MPLIGRRRPLARVAMVGGAGYMAGKRRAQAQEAEAGQPSDAPAPGGEGASGTDRLDALKKLGELHDTGVLTDEQFEAEKEKYL